MTRLGTYLALACMSLMSLSCGSGSTSGGPNNPGTGTAGIAVPLEISALPTASSAGQTLRRALGLSGSALSADSDYETAATFKYVDERSLSQFEVLNTIFKAVAQTHYADPENVGQGPYGAMVAWVESNGDLQAVKKIKSWVVQSSLVVENGHTVNHMQAWMRDMMSDKGPNGMAPPAVIRADLSIVEAPVQRADGSYSDYGVWTLIVDMSDDNTAYFAASAERDANGLSVVKLHQHFPGEVVRGILHKSDSHGFGKVDYPDWSSCNTDNCQPPNVTVSYVYDADHVALKKGDAAPVFKDRGDVIDVVNQYALFDASTGAEIAKSHSFGFPVQYTSGGQSHYGYYGAWQGRHQLWADGQNGLPEGTTVSRSDHGSGHVAQTYTTSKPFTGVLVKRSLVDSDPADLAGLVFQTWLSDGFNLSWTGSEWDRCTYVPNGPPTCAPFTDWASLVVNPNNPLRNINIGYFDQQSSQQANLMYVPNGPAGAGLYPASMSQPPQRTSDQKYQPSQNAQLWVNLNGAIFLTFDGTVWWQKTVASFDQSSNMPTFQEGSDQLFNLEEGRQYYMNGNGVNYIVTDLGATYSVKVELQSVANPVNAATFLAGVDHFTPQWASTGSSTYRFVTDSSSGSFLKLVYDTVGTQDQNSGISAGDAVTTGQWSLLACAANGTAVVDGVGNQVQFNWDYPQNCQNCDGGQQFLMSGSQYVMLDDPIRLASLSLVNHHGDTRSYALQFDGSWVSGLPNIQNELQQNGWEFTQALADKLVAIPNGTEVTDAGDAGKHYLFKQIQVSEYLSTIGDPGNLDLSQASGLDLTTVTGYSNNGMGTIPDVPVKYSEGVLVQ
jgi:hypothetical protein